MLRAVVRIFNVIGLLEKKIAILYSQSNLVIIILLTLGFLEWLGSSFRTVDTDILVFLFFAKQFLSLRNKQVPSSTSQMRPKQLNQNCSAIGKCGITGSATIRSETSIYGNSIIRKKDLYKFEYRYEQASEDCHTEKSFILFLSSPGRIQNLQTRE